MVTWVKLDCVEALLSPPLPQTGFTQGEPINYDEDDKIDDNDDNDDDMFCEHLVFEAPL